IPNMGVAPGGPAAKLPNPNQFQQPPFQPPPFAVGGGLFGQSPLATSPEGQKLLADLTKILVGRWEGTASDGSIHKIEYRAHGQYEVDRAGSESASDGTWRVAGLVGTKGLKLTRGNVTVKVVFEDDELIHDTGTPGRT